MEKKHYILIGALVLIAIAIVLVNVVKFGGEKEIKFEKENDGFDLPQKNTAQENYNSIGEIYEPVELNTLCSR